MGRSNKAPAGQGGERQAAKEEPLAHAVQSLSHFIGKVLDQFATSSWVPAIMLVGNLALLLQLGGSSSEHRESDGVREVSQALDEILGRPLDIVVVLPIAVLLAAAVTQAFGFESIRLLEGYWPEVWPVNKVSALLIEFEIIRLGRLQGRYKRLEEKALTDATERALRAGMSPSVVSALAKTQRGSLLNPLEFFYMRTRPRIDLLEYARPRILRAMENIASSQDEFPRPARILPTRLGNILRATEDSIDVPMGVSVEDYVQNIFTRVSTSLQIQHDQFRTRLETYSVLVLTFLSLSAISPILLESRGPSHMILGAGCYLALSVVSYCATIAAARGYSHILRCMDQYVSTLQS